MVYAKCTPVAKGYHPEHLSANIRRVFVKKGQLISNVADDALGAYVHASIDGKVTRVTEKFIIIEAE